MSDPTTPSRPSIPDDDPSRSLAVARPDIDESLPHIGVVGDTYTVLLSGSDTNGRFALIDMHIPSGGGPAPHRHDFEETFSILAGEIEITFREQTMTGSAGDTVNVPANATHAFHNASDQPARMLCLASPAGVEEFFAAIGTPVARRTEAPPKLDQAGQAAFIAKAREVGPRYHTQLLPPPNYA
jgi:quercetin dioxygenase-like cupin family protein